MRYARQTVLPEIGIEGQAALARARVLVIGAGGLGCPTLLYLTAAGVGLSSHGGCVGIMDDDLVTISNLQRQILYTESDLGLNKADAAVTRLRALNSETDLRTINQRLSASNALDILSDYQIVVDGSDNFDTKYLVNDASTRLGLPVVYGSILGLEGQVSVFWGKSWGNGSGCYRCLYPEPPSNRVPNCAEAGTLGALAGMIGTIQAVEVCKLALGEDHCSQHGLEPLIGKLLITDARNWDTRSLCISARADCRVCAISSDQIELNVASTTQCSVPPNESMTLSDFNGLIESGIPFMLIDVRGHAEWSTGHIQGAQHFPLDRLLSTDDLETQLDAGLPLVVYCQHGIRSQTAVQHLRERGFNAINLNIDGAVF